MRLVNAFMFGGLACALVAGCTGLALQSGPGGDGVSASLSTGGIAVDPRTETTFVLGALPPRMPERGAERSCLCHRPRFGRPHIPHRISRIRQNPRRFPKSSCSSSGRIFAAGTGDTLMRFDESNARDDNLGADDRPVLGNAYLAERAVRRGRRQLPSHSPHPPHRGRFTRGPCRAVERGRAQAMWLHASDTLVAAYFTAGADAIGTGRFVGWSIPALEAQAFPIGKDGFWAAPSFDVTVQNVGFDLFFSYTWVGISPDDSTAVFPVITQAASGGTISHELVVVDSATGGTQTVPNAYGPGGLHAGRPDDRVVQLRERVLRRGRVLRRRAPPREPLDPLGHDGADPEQRCANVLCTGRGQSGRHCFEPR